MDIRLNTPVSDETINRLKVGDKILISGKIYTGRDAVLPKICELIRSDSLQTYGIDLQGSLIFHTAVSVAGVGPTSSNKYEIESSIPMLSSAGVKIHLGKGALSEQTVRELDKYNSIYAVIPPVTALLNDRTHNRKVAAYEELGMEAFYEMDVVDYPAIVAICHGQSIYNS